MGTYERVRQLFADKLDFKEDSVSLDATLESLGLDSLDRIEFIFAIEDEFNIKVPERDVTINTVQDLVSIIDRLVAEQQGKA
ncbi:MAG: acyl carrier protein [Nitrospirae bacterium]|nr:MAG: acyl carrier protein [Nitrospirota bacterium]